MAASVAPVYNDSGPKIVFPGDFTHMDSSRRDFLAAGLKLPAAGLAASALVAAPAPAELTYRTLGKTGLKVTPLTFGGGSITDPSLVTRAADMGINCFDTARIYAQGNSERLLGVGLKGKRDKVVLMSKTEANDRAGALAELDTTLKGLGTDHLDVWFLHARDNPAAISAGCVDAQETAKKQGKTRFLGVSTHDPAAVADHIVGLGKHDVVLFTYNFSMGAGRDAAIAKLRAAGIGLAAMKVTTPSGGGFGGGGGRGAGRGPGVPAQKPGAHLAALKWALKNPAIATATVTMTDTDALDENFRAITERLNPEEEKLLAVVNEDIRPAYCRMCYQCDGNCPKGVPVPSVLRYLAYADFNGDFPMGRRNFEGLPQAVRQVRCGDCGSCAIQCPNGVRVQERLVRAQEMFA